MGGLAAPVIGTIGDHFGLEVAMIVVASISILITVSSLLIPQRRALAKPPK
jgi:hypothetical protein